MAKYISEQTNGLVNFQTKIFLRFQRASQNLVTILYKQIMDFDFFNENLNYFNTIL